MEGEKERGRAKRERKEKERASRVESNLSLRLWRHLLPNIYTTVAHSLNVAISVSCTEIFPTFILMNDLGTIGRCIRGEFFPLILAVPPPWPDLDDEHFS